MVGSHALPIYISKHKMKIKYHISIRSTMILSKIPTIFETKNWVNRNILKKLDLPSSKIYLNRMINHQIYRTDRIYFFRITTQSFNSIPHCSKIDHSWDTPTEKMLIINLEKLKPKILKGAEVLPSFAL